MALTLPGPLPALNGKYHTFWRVVFVAVSVAFTSGITAAFFLLIPTVNNSVKLALAEGGLVFVMVAIVPAGILSSITLGWGIIICGGPARAVLLKTVSADAVESQ